MYSELNQIGLPVLARNSRRKMACLGPIPRGLSNWVALKLSCLRILPKANSIDKFSELLDMSIIDMSNNSVSCKSFIVVKIALHKMGENYLEIILFSLF